MLSLDVKLLPDFDFAKRAARARSEYHHQSRRRQGDVSAYARTC